MIVDDNPDITTTFKLGLEMEKDSSETFQVHTYTDPLTVLSDFKPNFFDLLLVDINMPKMNGFELCEKILRLDVNVKVCFVSAGAINLEAIREIPVLRNVWRGCFIKKPISIDNLVKRLKGELN